MALATQCPNCQSRFRVQSEHLKTGGGLVRCGLCRHVFNALDHLAHFAVGEPQAAVAPPVTSNDVSVSAPSPAIIPPAPPSAPASPSLSNEQAAILALLDEAEPAPLVAPVIARPVTPPARNAVLQPISQPTTPTTAPTTVQTSAPAVASASQQWEEDPVTLMPQESGPVREPRSRMSVQEPSFERADQVMAQAVVEDDAPSENTTQELADFIPAQPEFIQTLERQEKRRRVFNWLASIGALLALTGLLFQVLVVWRADIVAHAPGLKPLVSKLCQVAHCQIGLPQHIEQLRITGSELQPDTRNRDLYTLALTLENQSQITQAWPHIEVTLTDVQNKAVARRVFSPQEYVLPVAGGGAIPQAELIEQGLLPHRELAPKVFFDAGKVKAAGYLVYIFYP
jgi:predicted Zn finger-like uncharacterized protein